MERVHRFKIPVNCADFCCESGDCLQDGEQIYYDYGFLALPKSYTESGAATRLVISCHGAGGTVSTDDSQAENQILTKYLLANGYAVMDMNGLPEAFAAEKGIDIRNNIGSPIALQSYIKGYHYCIEHFNLKREVFVHGASMGGISSTNLVLSGCIPVIAQSGFCPVLDTYHQIYLKPWCDGLPKTALGIFYGLERDENGEFIYDEEKIGAFNPMGKCIRIGEKEYAFYPVPVKFWQCEDDKTVNIESTRRFVSAIRNAGGMAYLRTFAQGGHHPQFYGRVVEKPHASTDLDGEVLEILPAVEEVLLWLERFD